MSTENIHAESTSMTNAGNCNSNDGINGVEGSWNLEPSEDKNPFSGFSEEHLSKLDEFLSSEEAKKILQQTTEEDFSNRMSDLGSSSGSHDEQLGEDLLKMLDSGNLHSTNLDHPYCVRAPKLNISNAVSTSDKVTGVTEPSLQTTLPTALSVSPGTSPRKSARISLRREPEEPTNDPVPSSSGFVGALHPGIVQTDFLGAVHPGIVKPEHAGVGRGRGRGRRSLIPEETSLNIRRSSRVSDKEQRDLAEKIRQENLQQEREALEAMRKKESEEENKTTPRRGRPPKNVSEEDTPEAPRGVKAAVAKNKKGNRKEELPKDDDEGSSEEETDSTKETLKSPRTSSRATKGKKAKRFVEEGGSSTKEMDKKIKDKEENPDADKKQKKEESNVGGRGRKKKEQVTDSENDSPKMGKEAGRITRGKIKASEVNSDADSSPIKKGGKKGKEKQDSKEQEKSVMGKKKRKGQKVESESEDNVPLAESKKGKKNIKTRGQKRESKEKEANNTSESDSSPKKAGRKRGSSPRTPVKNTESDQESDLGKSPRSIFKMFESGLITGQTELEKSSVTQEIEKDFGKDGASHPTLVDPEPSSVAMAVMPPASDSAGVHSVNVEIPDTAKTADSQANDSKGSDKEFTLEFESKVEEISYEDFISSIGGLGSDKVEDSKTAEKSDDLKSANNTVVTEESRNIPSKKSKSEETTENSSKAVKSVKKKPKKTEEVKVDQSMLDLFKPDIDVTSKKKLSKTEPVSSQESEQSVKRKLSETEKTSKMPQTSSKVKKGRPRRDLEMSKDIKCENEEISGETKKEKQRRESEKTNDIKSESEEISCENKKERPKRESEKSKDRKIESEDISGKNKTERQRRESEKSKDIKSEGEEISGEIKKERPRRESEKSKDIKSEDEVNSSDSKLEINKSNISLEAVKTEDRSKDSVESKTEPENLLTVIKFDDVSLDKVKNDTVETNEKQTETELVKSENMSKYELLDGSKRPEEIVVCDSVKTEADTTDETEKGQQAKQDKDLNKKTDVNKSTKKSKTEKRPEICEPKEGNQSQTASQSEKVKLPIKKEPNVVKKESNCEKIKNTANNSEKNDNSKEIKTEKRAECKAANDNEKNVYSKEIKTEKRAERKAKLKFLREKLTGVKEKKPRKQKEEKRSEKGDADISESEDSDDFIYEDDENDSDYEAPDQKYCICRQPYGKRFMICCDRCENWYHGSCVGVTKAEGKEMERKEQEYICPPCKEKESTGEKSIVKEADSTVMNDEKAVKKDAKSVVTNEDKAKKKDIRSLSKITNDDKATKKDTKSHEKKIVKEGRSNSKESVKKTELKQDEKEVKTSEKEAKNTEKDKNRDDRQKLEKDGKIKGEHSKKHSLDKSRDYQKERSENHKSFTKMKHEEQKKSEQNLSSPHSGSKIKHERIKPPSTEKKREDSKKTDTPTKVKDMAAQRCILPGCNKYAKRESVYCSTTCIHRHAKDSLKILNKYDAERGKVHSGMRRINVIEKKSGKLYSGSNAPLESMLKTWLEQHPTFEVVRPRLKSHSGSAGRDKTKDHHKDKHRDQKSPAHSEQTKQETKQDSKTVVETKKEEAPDTVRLNVRKSLRDALINRAGSADDVMLSTIEIRTIALSIEEELFNLFQETSHKYKARYRSLIFNIKDSRNQGLFRKVLNGHIKPKELVRMTPDELASKDLARWREFETKHQLEMIEQVEKEHMMEGQHIIKKTHKGEIDMDEDFSTLEDKGVEKDKKQDTSTTEEEKNAEAADISSDTTGEHKNHVFDLNCKICTGKVAPPTDEVIPKKVAVAKQVSVDKETKESQDNSHKTEAEKTEEEQKQTEEVVKEVLQAIKRAKSAEVPKADSTVTVRSPDSALQSGLEKPKFTPSGPQLWKGFIQMQDVAKFVTTAYQVSGHADKLDLPDTIHVCGRIVPEQIWDYLAKMKKIGTKDIVILRFIPGGDEEKTHYINLYSYLNSRARCGVVGNKAKHIKDFYILPLASHSKIPPVLVPFDGPGLEDNRPHMLLAIIVKQKLKRHGDHDKHIEGKKSRLEPDHKKVSKSQVIPATKKESSRSANKLLYDSPSSGTSTPSGGSTPNVPLPATMDKSDPIIKAYGKGAGVVEDENDDKRVAEDKCAAEDVPYDPEDDSQLPYKRAKMDRSEITKKEAPKQVSVAELIFQISKCTTPADSTALTVAAISNFKSTQEKRRFLLDLTSKVEEQKKLLEKKQEAKLTAKTLVSAIYAISAASKALIPAAKTSKSTSGSSPSVSQSPTSTVLSPSTHSPCTEAKSKVSTDTVSKAGQSPLSTTSNESPTPQTPDSSLGKIEDKKETVKESKSVKFSEDVTVSHVQEYPIEMAIDNNENSQQTNQNQTEANIPGDLDNNPVVPNFYVENPVLTSPEKKAKETAALQHSEMPEALKSLFSVMPGSNYNYMSHIKAANESMTANVKYSVSDKKSTNLQLDDQNKSGASMFSSSLLDFDYGDSDSDDESPVPGLNNTDNKSESIQKHPQVEVQQKPQAELRKLETQKPEIEETTEKPTDQEKADKDRELMPPPPPLPPKEEPHPPETDLPPLPPEPPPPLPEHEPEEEVEEENKKKKKKPPKPPPEIVLTPTDPVGAAILNATFKKIEYQKIQEMTVPPPPLPPISLASSPIPPPIPPPSMSVIGQSPPPSMPVMGQSPSGMPIAMQGGMMSSANQISRPMPLTGPANPSPIHAPPQQNLQGPSMVAPPLQNPPPQNLPHPPPQMPCPDDRYKIPPAFKGSNNTGIPSIFDINIKPTKNFDQPSLEDEALILPLQDQDFREDQDFRQEDVDERKRPWKGQRQKFPPPWAQDVDHRNKSHKKFPIMPAPPIMENLPAGDSDFRQYGEASDSDYRHKEFHSDNVHDLKFTEDQDYRDEHSRHHKRRKKKRSRNHSPEDSSYKKTRHDSDRTFRHSHSSHEHRRSRRDDYQHGDSDDKKQTESKRPQRLGTELPKPVPPPSVQKLSTDLPRPVPPPGVVPSPTNDNSTHATSSHQPPHPRFPPRMQPAPPGVDDWN